MPEGFPPKLLPELQGRRLRRENKAISKQSANSEKADAARCIKLKIRILFLYSADSRLDNDQVATVEDHLIWCGP